jgi:hypothetical protein
VPVVLLILLLLVSPAWAGITSFQLQDWEIEEMGRRALLARQFEQIPIGETREVQAPCGCNICFGEALRVSENEVKWSGFTRSTLANCADRGHIERFK